jgi:hypothetical protein
LQFIKTQTKVQRIYREGGREDLPIYRELWKGANPASKTIYKLAFNPILKQGNVMNKVTLPLCKSGPLISENLPISQKPNMPASQYDYLHEESFSKTPPSSLHNRLQIIITDPINLKVGFLCVFDKTKQVK